MVVYGLWSDADGSLARKIGNEREKTVGHYVVEVGAATRSGAECRALARRKSLARWIRPVRRGATLRVAAPLTAGDITATFFPQ